MGLCAPSVDCARAAYAYLAAGVLVLDEGPTSIDEAVAILRESRTRSDASREDGRIATLALALALGAVLVAISFAVSAAAFATAGRRPA